MSKCSLVNRHLLRMILIGTMLMAMIGCWPLRRVVECSNPSTHFVLPDGFIGKFKVVLDEIDGLDVKPKDGRYIYEIPQDGVLGVRSFQAFLGCHQETAAYKGGQEIPTADSSVKPDAIALRGGRGSGSREVGGKNEGPIILSYVIGTQEQSRKLLTDPNSAPQYEETLPKYNIRKPTD